MSEVETRLAEVRERVEKARLREAPFLSNTSDDVEWLLDQLARVRTDTITEAIKAIQAVEEEVFERHATTAGLDAAIRGVSHEH